MDGEELRQMEPDLKPIFKRAMFMPEHGIASAYRDMPFPIGHGQTISQPTVVALMTQALALEGTEKVLEIGTGSGYQAAVASLLARELYTIELVEALGRRSQKLLSELGYTATPGANAAERAHHADGAVRLGRGNVHVRIGDGYAGWPEQAPFDRILLTAAPPQMPAALVAQLADGGVIVAPIGRGEQQLVRWVKRGNELDKKVLGAVRFVPMVPGK